MRNVIYSLLAAALASPAGASTLTFTQSAAFFAAVSPRTLHTEDFASATDRQILNLGGAFNGLTFQNLIPTGTAPALMFSGLYSSFSGFTLGADHTNGALDSSGAYFRSGEGASVQFAAPVYAAGVFFNVDPNPGATFTIVTSSLDAASTTSGVYDLGTFVFVGILSDDPFSGISFSSAGANGYFNVAEFVSAPVPEPSTLLLSGLPLAVFCAFLRKRPRPLA